jgi:molybdenum cofactor cytidylyltransferase
MTFPDITAIVLAAGESRRMGQPKMLLPWGESTLLGRVISTFEAAGLEEILVVTGGARKQVEAMLAGLTTQSQVRSIFNPEYAHGEMLSSIQTGLGALRTGTRAALISLGDQPQVREDVIRRICEVFDQTQVNLVVPSFQNRRGHPWLVAQPLWADIRALPNPATPRQFLQAHSDEITYLPVDDDSILRDIDTPEDYQSQHS